MQSLEKAVHDSPDERRQNRLQNPIKRMHHHHLSLARVVRSFANLNRHRADGCKSLPAFKNIISTEWSILEIMNAKLR